jgi:hypothetical protein
MTAPDDVVAAFDRIDEFVRDTAIDGLPPWSVISDLSLLRSHMHRGVQR